MGLGGVYAYPLEPAVDGACDLATIELAPITDAQFAGIHKFRRAHPEVCVACDESAGMLIVVRDPGPGFDPAAIASPTVGQNIYRHHGRGIYLINELMDEVSFDRGGTEIRMRKR